MAKLGLKKAAEETGKSPSTIHRAMDAGRLSYELNEHGDPVAYGQKTAVRRLFVYRRSGRSLLRDRAVSTSK